MWMFLLNKRGVAAVEFSLIAPIFLALVLGAVCFGSLFGTYHSIQELAAAAARAAVSGLSDSERSSLAQQYVAQNINAYILLDQSKLTMTVNTFDPSTRSFEVELFYDNSASFVYAFAQLVPLPDPHIQQTSVMQRGGY